MAHSCGRRGCDTGPCFHCFLSNVDGASAHAQSVGRAATAPAAHACCQGRSRYACRHVAHRASLCSHVWQAVVMTPPSCARSSAVPCFCVCADEMLGFMSHEIRNPAHIIAASCSLLSDQIPLDHPGRPDLESIQQSSEAMHRLINDVINYSALRKGKLEVRYSVLRVRPFIERVAKNHRAFSMVPIMWKVDADVPMFIISDPMRLQQILANGLTNAAKFCKSGSITVQIRLSDVVLVPRAPTAAAGASQNAGVSSAGTEGSTLSPASPPLFVTHRSSVDTASSGGEHELGAVVPMDERPAAGLPMWQRFIEIRVEDTGIGLGGMLVYVQPECCAYSMCSSRAPSNTPIFSRCVRSCVPLQAWTNGTFLMLL
ncbi:hypothetical protein EON66_01495 [archaeon]|nr:MAG: hypothetical protein EON66_01495 [archaeon]